MESQLQILREMYEFAKSLDREKVLELNKAFDKTHHDLDNCRQSIVLAVTKDGIIDRLDALADAKSRLESLRVGATVESRQ